MIILYWYWFTQLQRIQSLIVIFSVLSMASGVYTILQFNTIYLS